MSQLRAQADMLPRGTLIIAGALMLFALAATSIVRIAGIPASETRATRAPRSIMRGLARDRRARGIGEAPSFNLTLWRDGELSLTDSATHRSIEMTAFGPANRAAFAALLSNGSAS